MRWLESKKDVWHDSGPAGDARGTRVKPLLSESVVLPLSATRGEGHSIGKSCQICPIFPTPSASFGAHGLPSLRISWLQIWGSPNPEVYWFTRTIHRIHAYHCRIIITKGHTDCSWSKEELHRAESGTGRALTMKYPCPLGHSIFLESLCGKELST